MLHKLRQINKKYGKGRKGLRLVQITNDIDEICVTKKIIPPVPSQDLSTFTKFKWLKSIRFRGGTDRIGRAVDVRAHQGLLSRKLKLQKYFFKLFNFSRMNFT